MVDEFSRARLDSLSKKKYEVKVLQIRTAKQFLVEYHSSRRDEGTLQQATLNYNIIHKGIVNQCLSREEILSVKDEEIESVYREIKQNAGTKFIAFYESYRRKIDQHYFQDYVNNALRDVRMAYQVYRKSNNPDWNATAEQISISEMDNLYNILTNTKSSQDIANSEQIK